MNFIRSVLLIAVGSIALLSCKETSPVSGNYSDTLTSFKRLQQKVLNVSCATSGCHTSGAKYAEDSDLILTADSAYDYLVGVLSKEPHARADALLRVKQGDPLSSLLYLKVADFPNGKAYGAPMPLGMKPLSVGQIEFIRQWILKGAKKTGDDIDPSLLDDTTTFYKNFEPLPPPPSGLGFQLTTGKFSVAPNFEREIFVYRKIPTTTGVYVNRIQCRMRTSSHHLVLSAFDPTIPSSLVPQFDVIRDLRNPDGTENNKVFQQMQYHVFLGGSMRENEDYSFPPGVALYLPEGMGIDFNTHYVNYTTQPIDGECYANFYTVPAAQVQKEAYTLFLNNLNITLPPHQRTVVSRSFLSDNQTLNIFMLTSHSHKYAEKFQIKIIGGARNGEIVYESTDWEHPDLRYFDPPIVIGPNEGIQSIVTYNNTTDRTIRFGLTSEDEMSIIYGYYYE